VKLVFAFLICSIIIVGVGCGTTSSTLKSQNAALYIDSFCEMLQGTYTSESQSKKDTSYFHIALAIYPIWPERNDARYFYVEQAMAPNYLDKPYRQRVYKIVPGLGDTIISVIYTFKDPLNYAGAHKDKAILAKLTYDKIEQKDGCEVYLIPHKDGFKGGTKGSNCPSTLRGAAYATTEVTMTPSQLLSWDRGYDKEGKYVWGAEKGGYVFDKISK
jgi:CpeT protein